MDFDFQRAQSRLRREQTTERNRQSKDIFSSGNSRSTAGFGITQRTSLITGNASTSPVTESRYETTDESDITDSDDHAREPRSVNLRHHSGKKNAFQRAIPTLQELCLRSLCQSGFSHCKTLEDVPDELVLEMLRRVLVLGKLSPDIAAKFQTSSCPEVTIFYFEIH